MRVAAVVCNYRTPWDLDEFVNSWEAYAPADTELTIANVDPLQGDLTVADAAVERTPGVTHLPFAANVGYGRAVNESLTKADADVLCAFNADVVLTEGLIAACAGALAARPDWGVLGPRQVDQQGRITHAGIFGSVQHPRHRAWRKFAGSAYEDVRDDAVMVSGSALFLRRDTWDLLTECTLYRDFDSASRGPLLESSLFFEDTWLCRHALAHDGLKCVFFGPVTAVHKWHRSVVANRVDTQPLMEKSRQMFRAACDFHGLDHE